MALSRLLTLAALLATPLYATTGGCGPELERLLPLNRKQCLFLSLVSEGTWVAARDLRGQFYTSYLDAKFDGGWISQWWRGRQRRAHALSTTYGVTGFYVLAARLQELGYLEQRTEPHVVEGHTLKRYLYQRTEAGSDAFRTWCQQDGTPIPLRPRAEAEPDLGGLGFSPM